MKMGGLMNVECTDYHETWNIDSRKSRITIGYILSQDSNVTRNYAGETVRRS